MNVHFVRKFPTVEEGREAKSIYMERAPGQRYFTIYVTFSNPENYTCSIPPDEIGRLIAEYASSAPKSFFVETIEERDTLLEDGIITTDSIVVVKDATGDERFKGKGGVGYFYSSKTESFVPAFRTTEDPLAQPKWEDLGGRPESDPKDIDEAVKKSHGHNNLEVLDQLGVLLDENQKPVLTETGAHVLTLNGFVVSNPLVEDPRW